MNYYDARELQGPDGQGTGRWHYTCMNDGRIWPIGYCRDHEGHASKQEAYECFKLYCLDHRLRLDGQWADAQHKCVVCGAWTQKFAEVNHVIFDLCDEHRTREQVAQLFNVGYTISSY